MAQQRPIASGRQLQATRWIALLEALKGLLVLLAGTGALALLHHDVANVATQVRHLLNASR